MTSVSAQSYLKSNYIRNLESIFVKKGIEYMLTGPVVATVWQGTQAVKVGRRIVGETDPIESLPGTIRGDYCVEKGKRHSLRRGI